jgi:glycosyltransferase involved in cell wall biosynthesis
VVWYSPTIFLGPVARLLKKRSNCRGYLIVRDIFPKWAVDTGLISKGIPYRVLQLFEKYQYWVADIIGVQTKGNLHYFSDWDKKPSNKLEVLHNWLSHSGDKPSSVCIESSKLGGRKIFVYAGNMGLAQGMEILFQLVVSLADRKDIGFVFVGRGSEMERFSQDPAFKSADNILFFDQIHADEIPSLFNQCHVGMLSLDVRHTTHNIPGKFLSYLASGLPVLASVNPGNDIVDLIKDNDTGRVVTDGKVTSLTEVANELANVIEVNHKSSLSANCKSLSHNLFRPEIAAAQVEAALGD